MHFVKIELEGVYTHPFYPPLFIAFVMARGWREGRRVTGAKKIRPVIMRVKRKGPTTPSLFLASFKRGISVFATGWMDLCYIVNDV